MSEVAEIREKLRTQYPELTEEEIKILARHEQNKLSIKRYHASEKHKAYQRERSRQQRAKAKEILAKLAAKESNND